MVLGHEIACEARKYIGVVESPVGSNCGPQIDQFNRYYWGDAQWNAWSPKDRCQPYCTTFAFYVVDRATRRLGGQNLLPKAAEKVGGDVVWGNAARTLAGARARMIVDRTPAVGSVFFRTSSTPGDGSSGHMGIVVGWDGTTITTVEGNQGVTHRVGLYTYTPQDIVRYGFQFIHTERVPITATKNTAECVPVSGNGSSGNVPPTSGSSLPTTGGSLPNQPGGSLPGGSLPNQPGGNLPGGNQPGGSSATDRVLELMRTVKSTAQTTQPKAKSAKEVCREMAALPCTDVNVMISGGGVIRDMKSHLFAHASFADDITGAYRKGRYGSRWDRNGIATRHKGTDKQNDFSGWGMFRDELGNLWYVMNADRPAWTVMREMNLWPGGVTPYIFPMIRDFGDGFPERTSEIITGVRDQEYGMFSAGEPTRKMWDQLGLREQKGGGNRGGLDFRFGWEDDQKTFLGGREFKYRNGRSLYNEIQKIGRRLDAPIVMLVGGQPFTWSSAAAVASQVLNFVTTVVGPYAPQLGITWLTDSTKEILATVQGTLQKLITQDGITGSDIVSLLTPVVKSVAPKEIRGYVDTGVQSYRAIKDGNYAELARVLGTNADINQFASMIQSKLPGAAESLLGKVEYNKLRGVVQNIVNTRAMTSVGNAVAAGTLRGRIIEKGLVGDPDLATLFMGSSADTLLPMVPGISQIMTEAIKRDEPFAGGKFNPERANLEDQSIAQALTHTAMGVPPDQEAVSRLAYESALRTAQDAVSRGAKEVVLPGNIPDRKAECWAAKIQECIPTLTVYIKGADSTGTIKMDAGKATSTVIDMGRNAWDQKSTVVDVAKKEATTTGQNIITSTVRDDRVVREIIPTTGTVRVPDRPVTPTVPVNNVPFFPVTPTVPVNNIPRLPVTPVTPTVPVNNIPRLPITPIEPVKPLLPPPPPPLIPPPTPVIPVRPPVVELPPPPPLIPERPPVPLMPPPTPTIPPRTPVIPVRPPVVELPPPPPLMPPPTPTIPPPAPLIPDRPPAPFMPPPTPTIPPPTPVIPNRPPPTPTTPPPTPTPGYHCPQPCGCDEPCGCTDSCDSTEWC